MFWFRFALIALPSLVAGFGYLALGVVSKPRPGSLDGGLVAVYHGDSRAVDLLRGLDPVSHGIRDLVLKPLVKQDTDGQLVPGIASLWDEGMSLSFAFADQATALEAQERINGIAAEVVERLGISEVVHFGQGDLSVELLRPSNFAAAEILVALGDIDVLPIHRIRVELKVGGAFEYHRHFLNKAVEESQVKRVWFDSDSSYELSVAGEIPKFLEELRLYYGDDEEMAASIEELGEADVLEEPWVRFSVADDQRWEDGTPISAADLLFTINALAGASDSAHPFGAIGREMLRADAEDERTVRVIYRRPYSPGLVAWAGVRVLPSHYLQGGAPGLWPMKAGQEIPSSGKVVFRDAGDGRFSLTLRADAVGSFPRGGRMIRFLPEPSRMEFVASRKMGAIDVVFPECGALEEIMKEPGAGLVQGPSGEWDLIAFNLDRSLFGDPAVRKALGIALDRQALIDRVLAGNGRMISSIFAPESGIEAGKIAYLHDPKAAAELLAQAGWEAGAEGWLERSSRTFSFELVTNREDQVRRRLVEEISAAWQEIGVDARPVFLPWGELLERKLRGRDFDVVLFGWTPDPGWDVEELWSSAAVPPVGSNFFGFSDPRVDVLVEELRRTYAPDQRKAFAAELQKKITATAPVHFLFERFRTMVIFDSSEVDGKQSGQWQDYLEPGMKGGS